MFEGIRAVSEDSKTGALLESGTISEDFATGKPCGNTCTRGSFTVSAGALVRNSLRQFLDRCKFEGYDIQYHETKRLIISEFTIKGNAEDVKKISDAIKRFAE